MQARTADHLIELGYNVSFMPFHCVQPDDDIEEIRIIKNLMHSEPDTLQRPKDTTQALEIIGQATIIVGLRLHSLILASMQGTPHVSIDYDIKIQGFMEHVNSESYLTEINLGLDRLTEKTLNALEKRENYSALLRKRVTAIRGLINSEMDRVTRYITQRNI